MTVSRAWKRDGPRAAGRADEVPVVVERNTGDRVHAVVLSLGSAVFVAWWVDFLTRGDVRVSEEKAYEDFEKAFLLADGYVAVTGLVTSYMLWKGRPGAVGVGIAAGSGLTFLGLMDLMHDLQQGKFSDRSPAMATEIAIVAGALTLGPVTMLRLWRARRRLAG